MRYLLDTHTLIWLITDKDKLSDKVKTILEDSDNQIYVSAISFWEISLKYSLGKLGLEGGTPEDILNSSKSLGLELISLSSNITCSFHHLEAHFHKDPFDRMLIWLCISENYTLLTRDSNIKLYESIGLKTIW